MTVVHVPHSSVCIPEEYRKSILLSDEDLRKELVFMTDAFCDELYAFENMVVAPVSRFVCDMERFRDDKDEACAERGQGLLYTHTMDGRRLREFDAALRERVLREFYDPHHARLTVAVDEALEVCGQCLIIDGHSFLMDGCADFCIGTDDFHTPPKLAEALHKEIVRMGYSCAFNVPYSGTIVPMKHYRKDERVRSVMIEVNRGLYQVDGEFEKGERFGEICAVCSQLVSLVK